MGSSFRLFWSAKYLNFGGVRANCKKMDVKISKNVKLKSPNFWQNYFFLESYTIEIIGNDDSTRESKYIRNYMRPNLM